MLRAVICGVPAIAAGLFGGWIYLAATSVEAESTTGPALVSSSLVIPAAPASLPNAAARVRAADAPAAASELLPTPVAAPPADPAPEEVTHRSRRKQIARRLASRDATAGRRDDDDDDD